MHSLIILASNVIFLSLFDRVAFYRWQGFRHDRYETKGKSLFFHCAEFFNRARHAMFKVKIALEWSMLVIFVSP